MRMTVIPVVAGTLGTVSKDSLRELGELEIGVQIETIKTTPLFKIGQNTEKNPGDLKRFVVT